MKTKFEFPGFTLYELLIVVAITAILVVVTVPSLINYIQTRRLIGSANQLYHSLQFAKTEAVKRNAIIFFTFQTGSSWCYGSNATTTCNCATANSCGIGSVQAPNAGLITLSAVGLVSSAVQFDPRQGAASAATTITFTNNQGDAITAKIGLLGSTTLCSSQVAGYPAC